MIPLLRITLSQRRWSIFWWSAGLAAFIILELSVYSSVKGQSAQLNNALRHLPGSVKSLVGANTDLFSPVGYLNSRLFYLLLPLLFSILIIGLGSSLLAREESDGTLELILARPISRWRLLASKAVGGLLVSSVVALISLAVILVSVKVVKLAVPLPWIVFATLMAWLIALLFGSVAFAVTALGGKGRAYSIGIASLIGLGSYVLASLETNVHWLSWPSKFLPYHYYNPTLILNGVETWTTAIAFGAAILGLVILPGFVFSRRDIGK